MDPLTLIGAIPTALNTVNSLSSLFKQPYMPPKQYQENSREVFKKGGAIRGHNKYNASTHQQGGQLVNNQGIPDPNGDNEIEKKESKYTYTRLSKENPTYIFTPEDSQKVEALTKKYKNANTSDLEKNALELSIQRIEKSNEMKKKKQSTNKYMTGGPLPTLTSLALNPLFKKQFGSTQDIDMAGNNLGLLNKDSSYSQPTPDTLGPGTKYAAPTIQSGAERYGMGPVKSDGTKSFAKPITPEATQNTSNPLKTLDTLRSLTLAGSSLGLLDKADKENPIMTDYSKSRAELNKLNANLDPAREQVTQSSNQLGRINRNSASSYNTFANREAQRVANLQQSLSGVTLQEQQLRNNIAAQKAQFESGVARDNKQTLQQNRINNQQNEAGVAGSKERILQNVMNELDRRSTRENNKNLTEATTAETMALMSNMFPDFDASDPFYQVIVKKAMGKNLTEEEKEIIKSKEVINFKTR